MVEDQRTDHNPDGTLLRVMGRVHACRSGLFGGRDYRLTYWRGHLRSVGSSGEATRRLLARPAMSRPQATGSVTGQGPSRGR